MSLPTQETIAAPPPPIEKILATEISVTPHQIRAAIRLLDGGATVPFIARYRKEATGGLTDTHLRMLSERLEYLRELEERRISILMTLGDEKKLSPELKAALEAATTKAELEDLYLPFRSKKRTKAEAARECGLGPLADAILAAPGEKPEDLAAPFVKPEKNVVSVAEALAGAREILAERFSEEPNLTKTLREKFWTSGWLVSEPAPGAANNAEAAKFADYFQFKEQIKGIPSHRMLALLRGREEKVLRVRIEPGIPGTEPSLVDAEYTAEIARAFGLEMRRLPGDVWLLQTAREAWKYKMKLRLEVDMLMRLRDKAEVEAINVFADNLKSLLLAAPAGPRATIGLDPGFRSGVKVAILDKAGRVAQTGTIYPHEPEKEWDASIKILEQAVTQNQVELIAIGNGTASRETEKLVADLLKRHPDWKVQKAVVSEAGASVYSSSELASKELAGYDVTLRGAVSIARRLQDPLAELVKIDPKSIGVGQYQHDLNQIKLGKTLGAVVEDCVNAVGVDLNTASPFLLAYVSGLTKRTAQSIVDCRHKKGVFKNRLELLEVPDLGPKAFEQAAGFLRIRSGENPLDASGVHPESYPVVERILEKSQKAIAELMGNGTLIKSLKPADYVDEKFGVPTVTDILSELEKPGRDPRPQFKTAAFKEGVETLNDLKPGMILEGTVTNVANFGAFVDIGVHQDGLVHISELSDRYVENPRDFVKTGQIVKVRVLEIDKIRKRVALSLRLGAPPKKNPGAGGTGGASGAGGGGTSWNPVLKR